MKKKQAKRKIEETVLGGFFSLLLEASVCIR
jgi:hypothetical protein